MLVNVSERCLFFVCLFFFTWHFILNENILFWLTIFNPTPFVVSLSVFCSQIYTLKFNL